MPKLLPSEVVYFIDRVFPYAGDRHKALDHPLEPGMAANLAALVGLVEQVSDELIVITGQDFISLAASLGLIRQALLTSQSGGRMVVPWVNFGYGEFNPLSLVRHAFSLCPDQFPRAGSPELSFISDTELREALRLDISASNKALSDGEWKPATVLAGSLVEALLLWALQQRPPSDIKEAANTLVRNGALHKQRSDSLEEWHLHEYIEVAVAMNVINPQTASQARLAKDFRNLIHPGRGLRLGQKCDRGTALSAMAAVEHVIRDLTSNNRDPSR